MKAIYSIPGLSSPDCVGTHFHISGEANHESMFLLEAVPAGLDSCPLSHHKFTHNVCVYLPELRSDWPSGFSACHKLVMSQDPSRDGFSRSDTSSHRSPSHPSLFLSGNKEVWGGENFYSTSISEILDPCPHKTSFSYI